MALTKPRLTTADYLAIAIAPALIIALVGSLVFFLLDVGYSGEHAGRLQWILFWFVFGSVMLARVSIEQGAAHAGLLGAGLGLAVMVAIVRFVESPWIGCALAALIWWCSHKLTWNCTLLDESIDPSGEGLLETAGIDDRLKDRRIGTRSAAEKRHDPLSEESFRAREELDRQQAPHWKRWWHLLTDLEPRAHAPGLSVLYFSLAALPLFGLGQWLIPGADAARQASALRWLALYLASGLGLLMITSFLGLRRYLRRRTLEMPAAMSGAWIGVGTALVASILLFAYALPLPGGRHEWTTALRDELLRTPDREASQFAPLKTDGTRSADSNAAQTPGGNEENHSDSPPQQQPGAEGTSSRGNQSSDGPKGSSGSEGPSSGGANDASTEQSQSQDGQSGSENESNGDGQGDAEHDEQDEDQTKKKMSSSGGNSPSQGKSSGGTGSPTQQKQQQGNQPGAGPSQQPAPSQPASPQRTPQITGQWLRWLLWGALTIAVLALLIWQRARIIALLREIIDIWRGLLQLVLPRRARASDDEAQPLAPTWRPFSAFANPFADGRARRASPDELARYTFTALEAWARERESPRGTEQTPLEFTAQLAERFPDLAAEVPKLGGWVARSLYARQPPPRECLPVLQSLWGKLEASSRAVRPISVATGAM